MKKAMLVLAVLAMAAMIAAPAMAQGKTGDLLDDFSLDHYQTSPTNLYDSWSSGGTNNGEIWWNKGVDTSSLYINNGVLEVHGRADDKETGTNYTWGRTGLIYIDMDIKGATTGGSNFWAFDVRSTTGSMMAYWYGQQNVARGRNAVDNVTAVGNLNGGWQHLTMALNTTAGTADFLLGGVSLGVLNFSAGQAIGEVYFKLMGNEGAVGHTVYFDNLRIADSPVPEPGSMLALGSGLVGMAGFAIRRRRA